MVKEAAMIYQDEGYGITDISMKVWNQHKGDIGRILSVHGQPETPDEPNYTLIITGSKGEIKLSGCNCGYGGTGPNGTRKILEELGVDLDKARQLMYSKEFIYNLAEKETYMETVK
jgi:hypothetical protein